MRLKAAIERAIKFVPRGKNVPPTLQAVRMLPAVGEHPARLYSTAGHIGILVDVTCDLPNAVIPVAALRKLVKESKTVDAIGEAGPGQFEFSVTTKGSGENVTYTINGGDIDNFPGFPAIPAVGNNFAPSNWGDVLKVLHAVGKDDQKPDLQTVWFQPNLVVATDLLRVACADVSGSWAGHVSGDVFRGWPKGEVLTHWTQTYAYFRIGAELRFAALQPDCRYHAGAMKYLEAEPKHSAVVDATLLGETVRRALDVSPWKMVSFDFGDTCLTVRGYHKAREQESDAIFEAQVPYVFRSEGMDQEMLVNGKYLATSLKVVDTPHVRLRYNAPGEPLQIESGRIRLGLWPSPWNEGKSDESKRAS
jgi:hypothetical protein